MFNQPSWVSQYRWPETFRFKHVLRLQPFRIAGDSQTYVRLSARRYVRADVSVAGRVHVYDRPVQLIGSINTPVQVGGL